MTDNKCENCENEIRIQIRKGSNSCSLECDRALGIGKYADREEDDGKPIPNLLAAIKKYADPPQQTIINVVNPPILFRQCTCGHPGAGCYCR